MRAVGLALVLAGVFAVEGQVDEMDITPARQTHYFLTPACRVNPYNHFIFGLHEISYGLGGGLQAQGSILDNIGRIDLGLKYALADNMSAGGGLAHTVASVGPYPAEQRIVDGPGLGLFLCYGILDEPEIEGALTFHTQIDEDFSLGVDFGMLMPRSPVWSLVGEAMSLVAVNSGGAYFNILGGIRIHPPPVPYLNFDLGINLHLRTPRERRLFVSPHLDMCFGMVF